MTSPGMNERGMSLVEVLAALTVFAIITLGVAPLLAGALRGSNLSRASTVGRDVALQAMERVRGLPYFVSYAQTKKVDVLDMYFPCATTDTTVVSCSGEGTRTYNSTTTVFSVTCPAGVSGPSCAVPLPAGYSLLFEARFIAVDGATTVIPPSTYKRDPGPTESQLDAPPSQLIRLKVTALWSVQGRPQSFTLESIVGDRKFGDVRISGLGRVNYGVQVQTSFVHTLGDARTSDMRAVAGSAESRVESRLVSGANQQVRAAEVTLIRRPLDPDPVATPIATPLTGVAADFAAPPNQTPTVAKQPPTATTMAHPNLIGTPIIAGLSPTSASGLTVSTSNELPSAGGSFGFDQSGAGAGGFLFLQNQADTTASAVLRLDPTQEGVFSLRHVGSDTMSGTTTAETGAVGAADRRVQTTAQLDLELLRLMPTTFLRLSVVPPIPPSEAFVVLIRDFTARVDCESVGTASSLLPVPTWSANFEVWGDADQDGLGGDGVVELVKRSVTLNATVAGATPDLKTILAAAPYNIPSGNPLVYDGLTAVDDLYLFDEPLKKGYLTSFILKPPTSSMSADGKVVAAGVDGAIRISTVPTNPLFPESGLSVLVGSLNCEALDKR